MQVIVGDENVRLNPILSGFVTAPSINLTPLKKTIRSIYLIHLMGFGSSSELEGHFVD